MVAARRGVRRSMTDETTQGSARPRSRVQSASKVLAAMCAAIALAGAGCAAEPNRSWAAVEPYRLGASQLASQPEETGEVAHIKPSKVISAIVFERVTGRTVDPARLVER